MSVGAECFEQWLARIGQAPGVFMTGTDTGVGKTWIGVQFLQLLRLSHPDRLITPRKPIESGWAELHITETDSWKLALCGSGTQRLEQVCPYPLQQALSPPRAAALENKRIQLQDLLNLCQAHSGFLYIEGAGGLYSPLTCDGLNADLAEQLQLPVLLTSLDRVGAINSILLSCEALARRGIPLAAVILNAQQLGPAGMDNLQDLKTLLPANTAIWRWQDEVSF